MFRLELFIFEFWFEFENLTPLRLESTRGRRGDTWHFYRRRGVDSGPRPTDKRHGSPRESRALLVRPSLSSPLFLLVGVLRARFISLARLAISLSWEFWGPSPSLYTRNLNPKLLFFKKLEASTFGRRIDLWANEVARVSCGIGRWRRVREAWRLLLGRCRWMSKSVGSPPGRWPRGGWSCGRGAFRAAARIPAGMSPAVRWWRRSAGGWSWRSAWGESKPVLCQLSTFHLDDGNSLILFIFFMFR